MTMAGDAKSRAPFGTGKGGGNGGGRDTVSEPAKSEAGGYDQVKNAADAPKQDGKGYDQAAEKGKPQPDGNFCASQDAMPGRWGPYQDMDKSIGERGGKPNQEGSNKGQDLHVAPAMAGVEHKPFKLRG